MNRIVYISIGVIWLIVFSVVLAGVLVAPDVEAMGSLQKYKTVGQQYLDREIVDVSAIKVNDPDDEFLLMYAKYMLAFQNSENEYNAKHRLFQIALRPENLNNPELLLNAYDKLNILNQQTKDSYNELVKAKDDAKLALKKMKDMDLRIYKDALEPSLKQLEGSEFQFINDITQTRLALVKYYNAILDFLVQKEGAYTVENNIVTFSAPEDQQYYNQLKQGQATYEENLSKAFEVYQNELRTSNSKIQI
jgi:hypothetical protein